MIQAIAYDAVGTLIHVQPAVGAIYAEVGRRFGSNLELPPIQARFHAAFARQDRFDEQAGWRTDELREVERWRAIVAEVLDDVGDPAACFDALFAAFGQPAAWACDPEAEAVLDHFQQRGLRQALASNFDGRLRGVVAPMPIAPFLETIVISSEIGWRKPAPEFFAHLVEILRLPASAILFVGDDRTNDFEGARQAGMQAILLDPRRRHLDVVERSERLSELLTTLEK